MEESKKRTQRKSQGVRSRLREQSSKIVDMSWAAEYLDDDWENKYSKEGGYDTKAAAQAAAQKAEPKSSLGETRELNTDLLSQTQEFKALDQKDLVKIRDAVTDKTIVSVTDVRNVRDAASALEQKDDSDDLVKIRDAVTDKTIVSVTDVADIRDAAVSLGLDEDLDDLVKIRDAVTDKTIVSVTDASDVRDAAVSMGIDEDLDDLSHIRDARGSSAVGITRPPEPFLQTSSQKQAPKEEEPDLDFLLDEDEIEFDPKISDEDSDESRTRVFDQDEILNEITEGITDSDPDFEEEEPVIVKPERSSRRSRIRTADRPRYVRPRPEPEYEDEEPYYEPRRPSRHSDVYQEEYVPTRSPLRFIPLVLVIALCVFGFIAARAICYDVPVNASDYSKITYTVTSDLTDSALARDLMDLGLIDNELIFRLRCLFYNADYVPGTYELSPCYSTEKMINILSGYKYGDEE